MNSIRIYNDTDYVFTPEEQNEIRRSAINMGVDVVYTSRESLKEEDSNLFHFYATEDLSGYLFSIDTEAYAIWERA